MALSDSEFKSLQDSFGKPPLAESLDIASRTTPDAAAKSQKLGLSPDAYTANKPEIDRKLNLQEINPAGLQESHPATADWLSNPNNSSVAQGDLRVLKGVEDTVKSMQGSYVGQRFDELKSGLSNTGKLGYYASEAGKSMYNALPFVDQAAPGTSKADSLKVGTDILNAPMDATKSIARLANSAAKDLAVMPLGGIAVSIDKAFGTKLANKYVFPMAEYLDKSNQTLALRRNAGLVGKVSDTIGSLAGFAGEAEVTAGPRLATEATTAATKLWPAMANILRHGVASSAAPALTSAIDTGQAVYDQTKDGLQAFNAAQAYYLSTVGFMMAPFSYEGKLANRAALGVTTGVVGGEVAREYTNANMPAMPADMQKPASFEEALLNGIMGAGFGVIGGRRPVERVKPSPEARAISDTLDSIDEQHNIDKIVQYSQDSATNKVSKEHYNDFVKSLDPNRKVFIPQEAAAQMKDAPDYIKEQINGLGTDVSVPLHKFASDIATNKDWMDVVRPHIKLSDKSLSQTELSNGTNSESQAILKQAQQNKETLTEADKIYSDVKDQLVATGMQSEATARHSAELYPAIATVYAEKARAMGHDVSLSDIYNMMGFKVESGDVNKGTIIDQRSVPDTAFSPEKEQALTDAFKTDPAMPDKAAPEKVTLADKGFSPEEIASLQKDGMATDGTMDKPQFDQWQAERANRLNRDVPQGTSKASPEQTAATDGKQIDIPEGFDRFVELAKKSSSVEGFMEAAQKMNDTPQAVSQWFGDKYNPDGNLSMKKAAEKFLSDVKNGEYDAAPNKAQIPERRNLGANRPERRTDINHRQDINAMTDQQRIDELQKLRGDRVTDPLTQLPNDTAFNEDFADKSLGFDTVVALDMDGLGWHNDNWGHVVTDSILAQLGQRLKNLSTEDYKLYRLHGDEFAALTKGSESADKRSAEVQDILDNTTVKITGTKEIDGKEQQVEYTKVGLGLSYGVGDTYAKADEQSYTNKAQREASGKRSPKGTEPPGLHERLVGTGGQDNGGQASGVAYNQSAFHSSPHSFDKFSLDNIGTGEGAQAYGHGLYFAENTDVSNFYKQNVGAKGLVFETADDANIFKNPTPSEKNVLNEVERRWNRDNWYLLDKDEVNDRMGEFLDGFIKNRKIEIENPDLRETRKEIANAELDAAIKIRGSMKNSSIYDNPGYEYEVDIPDEHVKNFLNWDKPRSEQPESVQKALQPLLDSEKTRLNITDNSMLDKRHPQGSSLYKALINQTGSKQAASEYLNSLGIKGIKYLDGSSRAKGEGTHNLVVFDDSIIKILSRNGEPVTPAEAKQVKADMHDQQDAAPQKQTDTPEFRNWFGKSVVTKDGKAGGEPLVVYHGTSEKGLENSIFDKSLLGTVTKSRSAKAGFFFVDNKKVAEGYSGLANDKPVADLIEQSQRAERQGKWDLANELMVKAEKLEQSQKPSSKVVDSYLSIKDPYVFDAEEQRFLDIQDEIHDVIKEAQKNGNVGIVL
jgi:diguanylate cyclase (GGDEF)-like protein